MPAQALASCWRQGMKESRSQLIARQKQASSAPKALSGARCYFVTRLYQLAIVLTERYNFSYDQWRAS